MPHGVSGQRRRTRSSRTWRPACPRGCSSRSSASRSATRSSARFKARGTVDDARRCRRRTGASDDRGPGRLDSLCNVLADTYPDAEIILMGVREPKCLIHAPNESVDPAEIEHSRSPRPSSSRSTPRPADEPDVHRRGLARRLERAARQAVDADLTGVLVTPRARPPVPDRLRADRHHGAHHDARRARLGWAGHDRADPRAARRRGRTRRRRAVAARLDGRGRPLRGDGGAAGAGRAATPSPTRPGRCTCSASSTRCPGRATSR